MEMVNSKSVVQPIILLQFLEDNTLVVIDSQTTVRYFKHEKLELFGGFKVGIKHERYTTSVVSYSKDGEYLASLSADCKESRLYNTKTKKMVTKVDRHQGEASCVGIDPLSRYMFSCGDDGKTFAMDVKSGKLVFTLPHHADTINDIAFSKNGNWVATASYDRKISLYNLVTMSPKEKLASHSAPVMKLKFFGKNKLISVDKNSSAIVWDIYKGKVIQRLSGIHDTVTQICISSDEKFLFLGTALGYILLYDLHTYELLSGKYIKMVSPITALAFDGELNYLVIGTADGFLMQYDIYEGQEKLKELLKHKKFLEIQNSAKENPVLAYTKIYDIVANLWENTLKQAKIALQNGDKNKAMLLFKQFKDIPAKNRIIQKLMKDYTEYEKFLKYAKEGKLALAYSLANTYPVYKESKVYQTLEQRWKKAFAQAQKYILNPKGGMDSAKEILAPYRGISEKTKFIQELMTKGELYKRFKAALGQKNFRICFEMIKRHPFLKEFPDYDSLMAYGDTLYVKAHKYIEQNNTHAALKLLEILKVFGDFSEEAQKLIKEVELKQKFFNAVQEEDMATAYNMMATVEDLQETEDGKALQKQWNDDVTKANKYAAVGDVQGVYTILKPYLKIESKYTALATIFGWCYIVQLETALQKNVAQAVIEKGIKRYVLSFGLQDQIEDFFNTFKKKYAESKLNLEFLKKGSLSMWKPSMIVKSILD